jgi:tubulin---tyrosine ligase
LNDAFELRDTLDNNARCEINERIPFILKASILDKASELLIFYTQEELEGFFTMHDDNKDDDDDDDDDETIASVREWIVQRYIDNPKLLPAYENRKFHLRVYVVAEGNLRVHVYDGILALFASLSYDNDCSTRDRLRHITNTCAQIDSSLSEDELVKEFSSLADINDELRTNIFEQIQSIIKDIFTGLHYESTIFQPLANAFEIYGFDFLVDEHDRVHFLEANAYPDFKQTGHGLSIIIRELFENVVENIIRPYFNIERKIRRTHRQLHLVYDQQRTR